MSTVKALRRRLDRIEAWLNEQQTPLYIFDDSQDENLHERIRQAEAGGRQVIVVRWQT
jgi:hypothetical protein